MPSPQPVPVSDLVLDLKNYRTVPQASETKAIEAMIAIGKQRFWGLCDSLLESGFLPTENIIVLDDGTSRIVKEGNRRIAAMKLILGHMPLTGFTIPTPMRTRLQNVTPAWRAANQTAPCVVFTNAEVAIVNRLVRLAHGKGEDAARDKWEAIARARHHRDEDALSEPGLDLLERYLVVGQNVTATERELWAGTFPITVLDEGLSKFHQRFGGQDKRHLVATYPAAPILREPLEKFLYEIGDGVVGFSHIRQPHDPANQRQDIVAERYNLLPPAAVPPSAEQPNPAAPGPVDPRAASPTGPQGSPGGSGGSPANPGGNPTGTPAAPMPPVATPRRPRAVPVNDVRAVKQALKGFTPRGTGSNKVETLRQEILRLKLDEQPHAFCFVLRSMFEISAKVFCDDHPASGVKTIKDGKDRQLVKILQDIANHFIGGDHMSPVARKLQGAMTDLGSHDGLLSVTSMNQLIHNPRFTISSTHIATVFGNIFPLLEMMHE